MNTKNILLSVGLLLIILQLIVVFENICSGVLIIDFSSGTFFHHFRVLFGYLFTGIIGLVLVIISACIKNKPEALKQDNK